MKKSYLKVFWKNSLISIEYPKAAAANHNQYFRRDTRVCLFHLSQTNKQRWAFFCFLWKIGNGDKVKSYHSWIGQVQAKLQWRQNAFFGFFLNFLKLSPFCEILNVPANRAKIFLQIDPNQFKPISIKSFPSSIM